MTNMTTLFPMKIQKQNVDGSGHPGMTNVIVDLYYRDPAMAEVAIKFYC